MAIETLKEFKLNRNYNASIDVVWKAWTDPKLVQEWWGPRGVSNPACLWEPKAGGKIYIVMLAGKELGPMEGTKWPMKGEFVQVTPKSKLVFTSNAVDENDNAFIENIVTVEFESNNQETLMKIHVVVTKATGPRAEFAVKGMEMGWTQQFDKLGETLNRIT